MRPYKQITTELTFRCNAKCPACHRIKPLRIDLNDENYTFTLESFKKLFYPEFLKKLDWLIFNGNFGDSIMNRQFRDIIEYVKQYDTKINIHTNGAIHDKNYWIDVGNLLTKNDIINFAIDGLSDTHSTYRINTDFYKVFNNALTVISTNKPQVHWKYIVFSHNEHQVNDARELAFKNKFHTFSVIKTPRQYFIPTNNDYIHSKKLTNLNTIEKQILCSWDTWQKWYVSPEGIVFRCCWTGAQYYDENNSKFIYPKNLESAFNAKIVPIEKILTYEYWNKLRKFLKTYDNSFVLCKRQCGKLLSSREKIEENLSTNKKSIFEANNVLTNEI